MDKEVELGKAKRRALAALVIAFLLFVAALLGPRNFWTDAVKAMAEAAVVGALADWFAVVALFRRIPIPFFSKHTDIIPRNKDRIADNLAVFVQEKFLDASSIVGLIRKHDPAQKVADWLAADSNADRLGEHIVRLAGGILDFTDDVRIKVFIKDAIHAIIDKVDLSASVASILDSLTKDGRHQELLDQGVRQLTELLNRPGTRDFIGKQIIQWLKREHPIKERLLPTEWVGENGADLVSRVVNAVLDDVGRDDEHDFRKGFDRAARRLIDRLKSEPDTLRKADEIKHYLKNDETFNAYVNDLWESLRDWLRRDLASSDSVLHAKVAASGRWVAQAIAQDPNLRASLNEHMEEAAHQMAPDFAVFLTRHISDTVKGWDARDMSRQIELDIGKDLQGIRINGTVVGGCIGLALYLLSYLPEVVQRLMALRGAG